MVIDNMTNARLGNAEMVGHVLVRMVSVYCHPTDSFHVIPRQFGGAAPVAPVVGTVTHLVGLVLGARLPRQVPWIDARTIMARPVGRLMLDGRWR